MNKCVPKIHLTIPLHQQNKKSMIFFKNRLTTLDLLSSAMRLTTVLEWWYNLCRYCINVVLRCCVVLRSTHDPTNKTTADVRSIHDLHRISSRCPLNRQKIPRRTWEALIPIVVRRQQPHRGSLRSPMHEEQYNHQHKHTITEKSTKHRFNEVRPCRLRPRGNKEGEGFYWFQ